MTALRASVLLLLLSASAFGDYPELTKKAKAGDTAAQLQLAESYELDWIDENPPLPKEESLKRAMHWYEAAIKAGSREAHHRLAGIYDAALEGDEARKNAILHYTKAAERGHSHAQVRLAGIYLHHEEPANPKLAFKYYRMAAANPELPQAYARYQLGRLFEEGLGTRQDKKQALAHYFWGLSIHKIPPENIMERIDQLQKELPKQDVESATQMMLDLKKEFLEQRKKHRAKD